MKINEISNDKQTISARINKYVFDEYKKYDIPLTTVIECSLLNFLKLSNEERIKFLSENSPENVDKEEITSIEGTWKDVLNNYLKDMKISESVIKGITAGTAINAISIIAGAFFLGEKRGIDAVIKGASAATKIIKNKK